MSASFIDPTLLPPALAADTMRRALETAGARMMELDLAPLLVEDTDHVSLDVLEHLADQYGVEPLLWKIAQGEGYRRALVKNILLIKRRRGTPASVREMIRALGFGEVVIEERIGARRYDATALHDGHITYGSANGWAMFNVVFSQPISNRQVSQLREAIALTQGARNHLIRLDYTTAPLHYDAVATYNADYNHGSA